MPIYEFDCATCGGFSALRPIAQRNEPQVCPKCGVTAERQVVSAPALACITAAARHAAETNERSRHEPRHAPQGHDHGTEGACIGAVKSTSPSGAAKMFPGRRPWMISH